MTANELLDLILEIVDKEMSFDAPYFTDSEMSSIASSAQEEYVKTRYMPNGNKYRDGFENTEKRRNDLAQLIESCYINYSNGSWVITKKDESININDDNSFFINSSIIKPGGTLWKLPKDLLWVINEELTWNTTNECYSGIRANVKPITHDEYNQWKNNSFKKPYTLDDDEGLVWRLNHSREFNANTVIDTIQDVDDNRWYRVILPEAIDAASDYELVVNGDTYTVNSTGLDKQGLIDGFTALFDAGGVIYRTDGNYVTYIYSDEEITTNSGTTTNDLILSISYVAIVNQGQHDQDLLGTDYKVHQLITDSTFDIDNYYLSYIRRPRDVVCDTSNVLNQVHCELDESTHREIAEIAARKIYTRLADPRIQGQLLEENKSE